MLRALFAIALCSSLAALAVTANGAETDETAQSSGQAINPVVQWNRNLLSIVRTPGEQPATVHATRSFAIMHAAIYDAVNSIDRTHEPYLVELKGVPPKTSQEAAANSAAHEILVALYPTLEQQLDAAFQLSLVQIPDGRDKTVGILVGQIVANQLLVLRSNDGANAQPIPYIFGTAPGDYQSTPPNFPKQPQFTHWSRVTPFALDSASQFRPGPPPALTSDSYGDAFNEVKSQGTANSLTATADEALTGHFWNGAIQNYWNEIAQTVSMANDLTTAENARLFALLNLSFADGVIAFYDAKYTYNFWRPVTAIRAADTDNNPATVADPNWLPEVGKTAPDPSYPGAHAVISAAAATVLGSFFETDRFAFNVTSEVLQGVDRSFTSFSTAAEEATMSRIFAGQHFSFDLTNGHDLGEQVAGFVVDNFLTSRRLNHEERAQLARRQ
jgi:membrane-associated phospholipid phosphatase